MQTPGILKPLDNDAEEVAWSLATAEAMWLAGDRLEAVRWIRKAAESAADAGAIERSVALASAAADLLNLAESSARPAAPSVPPPSQPTRFNHVPSMPNASRPSTPPAAPSKPALTPAPTSAYAPPKPKPFAPSAPSSRTALHSSPAAPSPSRPQAPRQSPITAPKPRSRMATPAEVLDASELSEVHEEPPTERKSAASLPASRRDGLVASQAYHVVIWKDAHGVHVAPAGTKVNALSVEALLVATNPHTDLSAWLGGDEPTGR